MSRLVTYTLILILAPAIALAEISGPARVVDGDTLEVAGERIYHVPGGAYYDRTKISPAKGERWFCTEEEAQAAGWRRSKRWSR